MGRALYKWLERWCRRWRGERVYIDGARLGAYMDRKGVTHNCWWSQSMVNAEIVCLGGLGA